MMKNYLRCSVTCYQDDLPCELKWGQLICIDTERMGLNNYRDRVCLIQIFDVESNHVHIVKVSRRNLPRPGLRKVMGGGSWKLFHYALGDLVPLNWLLNLRITKVLCTKLLAKVSLSFNNSFGLKSLINRFYRRDLPYYGTTYWGGHITNAQLEYSINDVIYLHLIYVQLIRIAWLEKRTATFYVATEAVCLLAMLESDHWDYTKLMSWESLT